MVKIKILDKNEKQYYHQYARYHGDPSDDTTWEPGECYEYDYDEEKYRRVMIPLPYDPIFVTTDEEWLKNRILAYADENPLMCDIQNREQVENPDCRLKIMVASIPRGMSWLLKEDA